MPSLIEVVRAIRQRYPQSDVPLRTYNYLREEFEQLPGPRYLFRGENSVYPHTKSAYHRLIDVSQVSQEFIEDLLDLVQEILFTLTGRNIPDRDHPNYQLLLNMLGGVILHYGVPIMWLDFTSEVDIAAHFAADAVPGTVVRIYKVRTPDVLNVIYRLDHHPALRCQRQRAYAVRMGDQNADFQDRNHYRYDVMSATLTEEDKRMFCNPGLLSTVDDEGAQIVIDAINRSTPKSPLARSLFQRIRGELERRKAK
jgi:hypothetical protein